MKNIKRVLSLFITICLLLAVASLPAFAATTYEISGDSIIIASHDSAVKVKYSLTNGSAATTAEWSISSNDNVLSTYAAIDSATGELYVSKNALGKSFTISASVGGAVVATKNITVENKYYFEDFENEGDVDTAITSSFFSTKSSATVVANGTGKAAKTSVKLNTAGTSENHTMFNQYNLKVDLPENFEPKQYSISADVKVDLEGTTIKSGWTLFGLNYVDETGVACVAPARARVESWVAGDKARIRVYTDQTSGSGTKTQNDIPFTFNAFIPLNVTIDGNSMNLNINGQTISNQTLKPCKSVSGSYIPVTILDQIGFGTYIDNIEIYSGVKTVYAFATGLGIKGDAYLLRTPTAYGAINSYELYAEIAGTEIPENVVWSVENAAAGISVPDSTKGEVLVAGSTSGGAFVLKASLADGTILASKTITIQTNISHASQPTLRKDRYFDDFTNANGKTAYVKDEVLPRVQAAGSSQVYSPMGYTIPDTNPAYIRQESNGNMYASATGVLDLSGSTTKYYRSSITYNVWTSAASGDKKYWTMDMANNYTIEADMMAESKYSRTADREWTIFANGTNGANLDIRYRENADGTISIFYVTRDAENVEVFDLIAVKDVDRWFNFRIEADTENKTLNVLIDNVKVINNLSYTNFNVATGMYGISVDNLAIYTGSKNVATVQAGDTFKVFADGVALANGTTSYTWTTADAEEETSTASIALMSDTDYSDSTVFVAIYGADGSLLDVALAEVVKSAAGISLAVAEAEATVPANSYFKVFHWNSETLVPITR